MTSGKSYTQAEVAYILSVSEEEVAEARRNGLLVVQPEGCYNKVYIDQLRDLLTHAKEAFGRVYTELHTLQFQHGQLPKKKDGLPDYIRIVERCRAMVRSGAIIDLGALTERLSVDKYCTSHAWVRRRRIAAVKIGRRWYLSSAEADRFEGVYRSMRERRPLSLAVPKGMIAGWIACQQAADRIGVEADILKGALTAGRVVGAEYGGYWFLPPEEVEKWEEHLSTITPGFEWLTWYYEGRRPPASFLIKRSDVIRTLGIGEQTVWYWLSRNLLPSFPDRLSETRPHRVFFGPYIQGLARFTSDYPVPLSYAHEYAQLCAAEEIIW